jgi:type VI secretion system protein ImpK
MPDTIRQLTSECFNAVGRLRELDASVASPEMVQRHLRGYLDSFKRRALAQGMAERDVHDVLYALVALVDEAALCAPEPLRGYWMSNPLQLHYFQENLAGEGFFVRLQNLLNDGRRIDALRVFYWCLLFGFQGQYGYPGGDVELMRVIDAIRQRFEREFEAPASLSPAGEVPDEPIVRRASSNAPLWIALGLAAAALAVFVGLRISFDRTVSDLENRVQATAQ